MLIIDAFADRPLADNFRRGEASPVARTSARGSASAAA